jgi:MFS family permease
MRLTALVALLVVAMVASTLLQGAVGVLSSFIIDEFDISRSAFGLAFAAYSLVGGLSSLYMGALADRDSRRVLLGLFAMAGLGFVGAATAPTFIVLIIAMALGGVALGAGNPVTNRILAEHIPGSRRGSVIGLKQAGPLLGIFLAGAVLPPIALAFGWRTAIGLTVVLPLVGFVAALAFRPRRKLTITQSSGIRELESDVRFVVFWLSALGFGVSLSTSGLIAFLPLFAQESGGQTPTVAGAIAATMGLAGVVGRIGWGFF